MRLAVRIILFRDGKAVKDENKGYIYLSDRFNPDYSDR